MEDEVESNVKTFHVCQMNKTEHKEEGGLLQPLPIQKRPWLFASMKFISGFPKDDCNASIMVMVERFSKYSIFIASPVNCLSEVATSFFYTHMVKFFVMQSDIVSDRDARLTGQFKMILFNMMKTDLKFSTANHPQN